MPQTLKIPLAALKVVEPDEITLSMTADARTPDDQARLDRQVAEVPLPLSVTLDQLQIEPPPQAPQASVSPMGPGSMIGGTVGGIYGGPAGAAIGGAAGVGYEQLIRHAHEIPAAVRDVLRNAWEQPTATAEGFKQGAVEGLQTAGIAAGANAAMEYGGQKAMNLLGTTARAVYRGYLKPSLAEHSIKEAQAIVDTALKEGLPISKFGKEKADRIISELNAEVQAQLQQRQNISRQAFGDIDLHDIAEKVRQFARTKYYQAGRPVEDFEAAMKIADNIDAHPSLNLPKGQAPGPTPVTLTEANATKRTLQQSAGDRAFGVERAAGTEAEKRGAYELRQAIERRAPEVARLNARESKLIDAARAINRAIEREANQNALVGVKTIGAGMYGGVEYGRGDSPAAAVAKALAARALMTPAFATQAAILASRLARLSGVAPTSAARVAIAVLSESEQKAGE